MSTNELEFELQNEMCVALTSLLNADISNTILKLIGCHDHSYNSSLLWEWLYQRSVLHVPLGRVFTELIESEGLLRELKKERFADFGNRKHAFKSYASGKVYYWPHSPFLFSSSFGPCLFTLTSMLMAHFQWLHVAPDVLLTLYNESSSHLNFHQDIFEGKPEHVILFFCGGERDLFVKAICSVQFCKTAHCSAEKCIILTPSANTLFEHAKSTATTDNKQSVSIAFRNGISIFNVCRKSKSIQRKLGIDKQMLKTLASLGL